MTDPCASLFEPASIGPLTAKNRIVMPAVHMGLAREDGSPTDELIRFYATRSEGGAGTIIVGVCDTADRAPSHLGGALSLACDENVEPMSALALAVKSGGALAGIQLSPLAGYNNPTFSPSAEELRRLLCSMGNAARRAGAAGFDFVEIMLSGGSLLSHLLSPVHNSGAPEGYREGFDGRLRGAMEALGHVLCATDGELPVTARIHAHELLEGGYDEAGAAKIAKALVEAGVCAVNITGAGHRTRVPQLTAQAPPGVLAPFARRIAEGLGAPTFFGGRLRTPTEAIRALEKSGVEFVTLARALIADPDWAAKAEAGKDDEILPCMVCCGCFDQIFSKSPLSCCLNPRGDFPGRPVVEREATVLVAGSGPAGLGAALEAASLGARVVLFEERDELGGKWLAVSKLVGRRHLQAPLERLLLALNEAGVVVRTGTKITSKLARELSPDAIVMAVGGAPFIPEIPGIGEHPNLLHTDDVLAGREFRGDVAIIGGGGAAVELAVHLRERPRDDESLNAHLGRYPVSPDAPPSSPSEGGRMAVLKRRGFVGKGLPRSVRWAEVLELVRLGVEIFDRVDFTRVKQSGVEIVNRRTKAPETIPADTLVAATGYLPHPQIKDELADVCGRVFVVGDAAEIGNIGLALASGRLAAREAVSGGSGGPTRS